MRVLPALWMLFALAHCRAAAPAPAAAAPASSPTSTQGETLLHALLKVTGILAAPAQRGADRVATGSVWMATLAQAQPVRWTSGGGYRSPVIAEAGGGVYAMKGDLLVRIDAPGAVPVEVSTLAGIDRLLGVQADAAGDLLALTTDPRAPLVILSPATGRRSVLAVDTGDRRQLELLAQARSQSRAVGVLSIDVEPQSRQGLAGVVEWSDVVLREPPHVVRNLSACGGVDCGQPALSADLTRVVFIKKE